MNDYKLATRGSLLSILVYLILACLKLVTGFLFKASSLQADGLNNFSDIIASISVFIGLWIAKKPADHNHRFGHERYEIISSFIVSLLMFTIGFQVIINSCHQILSQTYSQTSNFVRYATLFSIICLFFTQKYLIALARKSQSIGLKATAKDMQGDLLISIVTLLGSLCVSWEVPIVDNILSIGVGIMIIVSAFDIFKESTFTLSDGFDPALLKKYEKSILDHPQIKAVNAIRARMGTRQIYLDVAIALDPNLTVLQSHQVTEELESSLLKSFQIKDVDIHVEPFLEE